MKFRPFLQGTLAATCWLLGGVSLAQEKAILQVTTLHPVLTELVSQVGGKFVKVQCMVKPGVDLHEFAPLPEDYKALLACDIVFASGKRMEKYLDNLRSNLLATQTLVEVGDPIPSLAIDPTSSLFSCCPASAANTVDPHWWTGLDNMKRAGAVVEEALAKAMPSQKEAFRANAEAWSAELTKLKSWAKIELSRIPQNHRVLATNHLAMAYFADEFRLKLLPLQGLTKQTSSLSSEKALAVKKIKELGLPTIFPEMGSNTQHIEEIQNETGTQLGTALIMDMNAPAPNEGFRAAFQYNIKAIVAGLAPPKEKVAAKVETKEK